MLMTFLKASGERAEAVLLAAGDNKMRVVISGSKDATELRLIKDQWTTENGVVVGIESLIPISSATGRPTGTMTVGSY